MFWRYRRHVLDILWIHIDTYILNSYIVDIYIYTVYIYIHKIR